jgi:hypothetical protein
MIDGAGIFYAEGAGHAATVSRERENIKIQDLTLLCRASLKKGLLALPKNYL